jgi:hypothetical protein
MINLKNRAGTVSPEPRPPTVELRFPVDCTEPPLAYAEAAWPHPGVVEHLEVELAGPGLLATPILSTGQARVWAGELFAAVSVAYREATGDPHALTDDELAWLPPADGYDPGPGVLVVGANDDTPARIRFHIAIDIAGHCLSTADLRAGIVEQLSERFNVARIAVSQAETLAGHVH